MSQSPIPGEWERQDSILARVQHRLSPVTDLTATLEDLDSTLAGLVTLASILAPVRTLGLIQAVLDLVLLDLVALKHPLSLLMTMRLRRKPSQRLLFLLTCQEETRDHTSGERWRRK